MTGPEHVSENSSLSSFCTQVRACFDLDLLTKVKYGIFACIITERLYDSVPELSFDERVRILYGYSKEVEYAQINLDILDDAMYNDFTVAELVNLL